MGKDMENDIIEIEGVLFYAPNKKDFIYKKMIEEKKIWEKDIIEKLCNFISPSSCVIDVGAHVGNHTIQFSKFAKKVFSFEPSPDNYEIFKKNIELNDIKNVTLYEKAICDVKKKLDFDPLKSKKRQSNSGATFLIEDSDGCIEGDTIDNIFADFDENISLIKYDIEEMELPALKGSLKVIEKFKPVLYVEFIKDKKRLRSNSREVEEYLISIGYITYKGEKEIWIYKNQD
jgi:FkbM family methyltransferase